MAEKETFNLTKYGVSFMLESQDLMEFIEGTDIQPVKETALKDWKEWKKRQSKTSVILLSSVDQSLHINLVNCMTPKDIWNKLHLLYGDMTEDAKQCCWQQFFEFRINDAEQRKDNLIARIIREDKRLNTAEEEASSLALQVISMQLKHEKQLKTDNCKQGKKKKTTVNKVEELKKKYPCNHPVRWVTGIESDSRIRSRSNWFNSYSNVYDHNMSQILDLTNWENRKGEIIEENSDQVATTVLEDIYNIDNKIQDDLDLIALVEGNPKLYAKGKAGYKNVQEKEIAWVFIGKALKHSLSDQMRNRWDTLRNLYSRARREILALTEQQGRSGSGRDNISYENLLPPQSMAIHRFMGHLYVPRKTLSNYTKSMSSASCPSSGSKYILPPRSLSKSLLTKSTTIYFRFRRIDNIIKGFASILSYFIVPTSDIKKRKKTDFEIDSMIKGSSQTIAATCLVLPTFLNATSKADTEEDKSLITFLSRGLKHVPVQQKIRCMIKILEVLESFQQN
ncbi:uncharacterized protein LOC115238483 [Formica exsecta]|uniref:uncharacterized protein LOC115238483 n=1 Tax=Formica exsecta TaxID=72781 RepID=UPI0011421260|nr:uncharacterized protein LOC115238483 [Formica exsecta]